MIKQENRTMWRCESKSADEIVKLIDNTFIDIVYKAGNAGKSADNADKSVSDTTVNIINETGIIGKTLIDGGSEKF